MELHNLRYAPGSRRKRKRVGRGESSGHGKTAGRGTKGQRSRSGDRAMPAHFEGGQMPLGRRVPKVGFRSPFRVVYRVISVGQLEALLASGRLQADRITPEVLMQHGLARKRDRIKILGDGELTRALRVEAHAASASARRKIEAAGGQFVPIAS
ncbi:MAG: 50S ribosomal protein L15 [Bacteroidota bacterium]|nr:50S ribosomal protein L15 [Bacteroidota bacterium]MDW8137356.1 50S ribosomal protein L15 [Bacteroidota bacterium]